jgi:hypothetical protein
MSPEHTTRTRRPVDGRSDLYSLGMVLYELLTGRLPFELGEDDQTNWAHYHIASEPLAPDVIRPDVPGMLSTIILKLLEKHPDNRYQTVDGLIADLRRCQATLTCEGEIVAFTPGQQDRTPAIHLADSLFATHPQANDVIAAFERVGQNLVPELVTIVGDWQIVHHRDGAQNAAAASGIAGGGESRSVFAVFALRRIKLRVPHPDAAPAGAARGRCGEVENPPVARPGGVRSAGRQPGARAGAAP